MTKPGNGLKKKAVMKRLIEELISERQKIQKKCMDTLNEIGTLIQNQGRLKKTPSGIQDKFQALGENLSRWMTIQDKEWDAYSNNHATRVFKSLQGQMEKLQAEYGHLKTLLKKFASLERSLQDTIDRLDHRRESKTVDQLKNIKEELSVIQYSDFEQRFRGDPERVRETLRTYVPFFADTDDIVDLGCGRGEFLELLREAGKNARGIDLSDSMLARGKEKGLTCRKSDILEFLKRQPDSSVGGIFSSQVIEHLPPDYLNRMVSQCFRVLKTGSPMVLETINPLSLFALSRIFFLDVTHRKPLHPEYMRYLLENSGFSRVEVHYTGALSDEKLEEIPPENPLARPFNTNVDKLNQVLFDAPHYAVTGTK